MIGSTDCQIVYLLLLLPLLLMAMLVVMMMPTAPTLVFMILYLCLSCQVTFACTIFIIVIIIIYTNPSGSPVPDAPFSVRLVQVAAVEFEDCTGCLFTGCLFTGCPFPDCLLTPNRNSPFRFENLQGSFPEFMEPSLLGCFAGIIIFLFMHCFQENSI